MIFNLEQTVVEINGHNVTGWSDDTDALSMPTIDIAAVKRGADGLMVASSTGDKGGPVILKLLANSPSTKFFMNLVSTIQNGGRVEFNGTVNDQANGYAIRLERGILMNTPLGQSLGKGESSEHGIYY